MPTPSTFVLVQAVSLFMACSAGMMIANKLVLRAARLPILVVIIQMLFTCGALVTLPALRNSLHFGSRRDVVRWVRFMPLLFASMLVTSMVALNYASMGAFVVIRNLAPLITLCSEGLIGEKVTIDMPTVAPLLVSLAGVVLYASHDVHFSPLGTATALP